MIKPFTCSDCGETFMLTFVPTRQRCAECAKARAKILRQANERRRAERIKMGLEPTPKKKVYPGDAKIDQNRKIQMVQCKTCDYRCRDGSLEFCDYVSWEGELRDRGEGPGKCGSYLPKGTKTAAERKARRKGLAWGESGCSGIWR
jgi:hypothetical protein